MWKWRTNWKLMMHIVFLYFKIFRHSFCFLFKCNYAISKTVILCQIIEFSLIYLQRFTLNFIFIFIHLNLVCSDPNLSPKNSTPVLLSPPKSASLESNSSPNSGNSTNPNKNSIKNTPAMCPLQYAFFHLRKNFLIWSPSQEINKDKPQARAVHLQQ